MSASEKRARLARPNDRAVDIRARGVSDASNSASARGVGLPSPSHACQSTDTRLRLVATASPADSEARGLPSARAANRVELLRRSCVNVLWCSSLASDRPPADRPRRRPRAWPMEPRISSSGSAHLRRMKGKPNRAVKLTAEPLGAATARSSSSWVVDQSQVPSGSCVKPISGVLMRATLWLLCCMSITNATAAPPFIRANRQQTTMKRKRSWLTMSAGFRPTI